MRTHRPTTPSGRIALGVRAIGAFLLIAGVLACVPATAVGADELTISITSGLDPRNATVAPGTTITWVNNDGERHRIRSTSGASFDSGNVEPGDRFSFTFSAEGRSAYRDDRDRDAVAYHGSVTVSGSTPPPTGPAPVGDSAPAQAQAPPQSADVSIGDRVFTPASLVIAPGGTVTWHNRDDRSHTATADGGTFDTGALAPGASSAKSYPAEGTFPYFCELHPEMTGVVQVSAAPAATPPPQPAPPPAPGSPASSGSAPTAPPGAVQPTPAPGAAAAAGPVVHDVAMTDFAFAPAVVDARVGDTIHWTNSGRAPHTATAANGGFDSGRVAGGGTFRFRATSAGTFGYACTFHPEMTGTLRVASGSAPPPAAVSARSDPSPTVAAPSTTDGFAGLGSSTPDSSPIGAPSTATVEAMDFEFTPQTVTIASGGTVTWQMLGEAPHSVTAADGSFDSGLLRPGDTFERRFETAGTFDYRCFVHPDMTGSILVVEEAVATTSSDTSSARTVGAAAPARTDRAQAWTVALLGAGGILGATALLLNGARRFLLAAQS